MGDRGNVLVKEDSEDSGIYLYTHWYGTELPDIVSAALKRGKSRWGDTPYLTRIIFCDMVEGNEREETGYGIGKHEVSGNHELIVVNDKAQTVTIGDAKWSYKEFSEHGVRGVLMAGDPAQNQSALYKCKCCG